MTQDATKALAAVTTFATLTLGTGALMVMYIYQQFVAQAFSSAQVLPGF